MKCEPHLIIAAALQVEALQLCRGKECYHDCLQTFICFDCPRCRCRSGLSGRNVFYIHEMSETWNVLYIFTTNTFAHGQETSTLAFNCLVIAARSLLINTKPAITKRWNTNVRFIWCAQICFLYENKQRLCLLLTNLLFTSCTFTHTLKTYLQLRG